MQSRIKTKVEQFKIKLNLITRMQQAVITRWEDLNGCKVLGGCKTCNLGSLGMLVWVVVLDWMRVWDYAF